MKSDQEIVERSGGWEVPERPDYDLLEQELIDGNFTFKRISGGADVFLNGVENGDLKKIAARNGFTFRDVEVVDGPHSARIRLERKVAVRNVEDGQEHRNRVEDTDKECNQ